MYHGSSGCEDICSFLHLLVLELHLLTLNAFRFGRGSKNFIMLEGLLCRDAFGGVWRYVAATVGQALHL